ncbi:MAG: alanine racemase [Rhodothermales bacterium]
MLISELPTPAVLIDRTRLQTNLDAMAERAETQGVALRPHTKTHKSVALAGLQRTAGATGLTVAKVGEAEVFAARGFTDIRLAYVTLGAEKWARLVRLEDAGARISFCVDTPEGARAVSDWYAAHDRRARVLLEIDAGYHRCGVQWDDPDLPEVARAMADLPGLDLIGILTHAGDAYYGPQPDADGVVRETREQALRRASNAERDRMLETAVRLSKAGLAVAPTEAGFAVPSREDARKQSGDTVRPAFEISIGSTPSLRYFENAVTGGFRVTEIRPGNYVFHDATQVGLGVASYRQCALTVQATVISKHRNRDGGERLFLDAGKKVFTSDSAYGHEGYGVILYNHQTMEPLPHHRITGLSEEHGWVGVRGGATLDVGDTVRIIPNHACVVVNTQREVYVVDGDEVVDTWTVDAQSRTV